MARLMRAWCLGSALLLFISSVSHAFAAERLSGSSVVDPAILSDGSAAYTPGISERRSSVSRFYHFGGQGENGRETASNESTASSRTWDAWGNPLSATGSTSSPFGAFGGSGSETEGDSGLIYSGEGAFYDPSIGRFIVSVSRSSPGGGYASFGDGGLNNPVSASGGPVAAQLVPAADGGGYAVGPSPASKPYTMLSGRLGYYGGSMAKALDHLLDAGVYAATETFEIVTSVLAVGALASLVDDAIRGIVSIGSRASRQPSASRVAQIAKDACFVAGTMILMADGSKKPIEEIQPGDLVMSRDEATGKTEAKEVVRVFERGSNALVVISLANGEEIKTTPEHPFWVEGKGWTIAGDLKTVDRLTTTSSTSSIASIQWKRTPTKVYNFEVKDYHTFFVSANGTDVWVHNQCKPQLSAVKQALTKAHDEVGGSIGGSGRTRGKFGSPQRVDGKRGYRLDPPHPSAKPGAAEEGWHINWWDYSKGKRGKGGRKGSIPIL